MKQFILNEKDAYALVDTLDYMFEKTTSELNAIIKEVSDVGAVFDELKVIKDGIENFSENISTKINIDGVNAIQNKLLLLEENIQNSFDSANTMYKEILVKNLYDHMAITHDYKELVHKKSTELFNEVNLGNIEANIQEQIIEKLFEYFGEDRINNLSDYNVIQLEQNIKKQEILYEKYLKNLVDQNKTLQLSIKKNARFKSMENIGFYLFGSISSSYLVYLALS